MASRRNGRGASGGSGFKHLLYSLVQGDKEGEYKEAPRGKDKKQYGFKAYPKVEFKQCKQGVKDIGKYCKP
jgi:hypothetical protein